MDYKGALHTHKRSTTLFQAIAVVVAIDGDSVERDRGSVTSDKCSLGRQRSIGEETYVAVAYDTKILAATAKASLASFDTPVPSGSYGKEKQWRQRW